MHLEGLTHRLRDLMLKM